MHLCTLFPRLAAGLVALSLALPAAPEIIRPRVVIVAMFEPGQDTGDAPGEFQLWVEREKLDRVVPLLAAHHDVRVNANGSVIGIVTGQGNSNAAASIMALGLDPRFDLSKSYWLVAGIAGVDPHDASIGSAIWTDYVVDGDLAHELDAREIPADWPTGYVPLGKRKPYELPLPPASERTDNCHQLNPALVRWAYGLTKDTPLADNDTMREFRARYTETPLARQPPSVLIGSNLASSTYWHGQRLTEWANQWVAYYTEGRGNFLTTAMEDGGTLRALSNLTRAGRADFNRVLILRTASNVSMQWPGIAAAESMTATELGIYCAYIPSLEAAHAVGSRVVHALVAGWKIYETTPPSAPAK